jgi:hypothetical protein
VAWGWWSAAARAWWPVVLATCASHSEPSRLGESLELLAQVRYQVGFASLEQNLVVAGELAAEVAGVSVAALFGAGFFCAMSTGRGVDTSMG